MPHGGKRVYAAEARYLACQEVELDFPTGMRLTLPTDHAALPHCRIAALQRCRVAAQR